MSGSEIDEIEFIDVEMAAGSAMSALIPSKSKDKYDKAYNDFKKWCGQNKVEVMDEKTLLAYYDTELKNAKYSTAWTIYSMLKLTLNVNDNIDVSKFNNLRAYLKRKSEGYVPKKSKVLQKEHVLQFIKDAPDEQFLAVKVFFFNLSYFPIYNNV